MIERRQFERKLLEIDAEYDWNGCVCPCFIVDVSVQGVGMRVKGCLAVNDNITLMIGMEMINAIVAHVDGTFVGIKFNSLTEKQMNYILDLKMEMAK